MRLVLAVVLGFAVGNGIYLGLVFGVLEPIQQASGESPEEWLSTSTQKFPPTGVQKFPLHWLA